MDDHPTSVIIQNVNNIHHSNNHDLSLTPIDFNTKIADQGLLHRLFGVK
jgi:hypothetical protein